MTIEIPISMTREELIEHLTKQVKLSVAHDAKVTRKHQQAEAEHLAAFRLGCRDALKLDYAAARAQQFKVLPVDKWDNDIKNPPQCPDALHPRMVNLLEQVKLSNQQKWTIGNSSPMHYLVAWRPDALSEGTVCS